MWAIFFNMALKALLYHSSTTIILPLTAFQRKHPPKTMSMFVLFPRNLICRVTDIALKHLSVCHVVHLLVDLQSISYFPGSVIYIRVNHLEYSTVHCLVNPPTYLLAIPKSTQHLFHSPFPCLFSVHLLVHR